jgi:hypothetical protein
MSFARALVLSFLVMAPVAIVAAIIGGAVGWIILAAGGVVLGLGLSALDRHQRTS